MSPGSRSPDVSSPPAERSRFPRQARIRKHSEFDRAYKTGRRHFAKNMTMFYFLRPAEPSAEASGPRVGLTVGKVLGNAVNRNFIKRRLREAVRLHLHVLPAAADVVINPKKSALTADFSELKIEVRTSFRIIAEKLVSQAAPSPVGGSR